MKRILILLASLLFTAGLYAADSAPYKEGSVVQVSYIKTKPGMFDAYVKWLGGDYKTLNEAYKKAGLILGYDIFVAQPRHSCEPDIILTITYPNMAALDNMDDKTAAIDEQVWSSRAKADAAAIDREKMREVLGSELVRQIIPK